MRTSHRSTMSDASVPTARSPDILAKCTLVMLLGATPVAGAGDRTSLLGPRAGAACMVMHHVNNTLSDGQFCKLSACS